MEQKTRVRTATIRAVSGHKAAAGPIRACISARSGLLRLRPRVSSNGTENLGKPPDSNLINPPFLAELAVSMGLRSKPGGADGRDSEVVAGRDAGAFEGIKQVAAMDGRSFLVLIIGSE
jgi:hypothetical protein